MQQVASYLLPQQRDEANEFLKTHKIEQQFFNKDTIILFYDNGEDLPAYKVAELQELLRANANTKFQQEVAMFVMERQIADLKSERSLLNTKNNKGRVEEVDHLISQLTDGISGAKQAIVMQDIKAEYVQGRIAALKVGK